MLRKHIYLGIVLLLSLTSMAQWLHQPVPATPRYQPSQACMTYPSGDSTAFDHFFSLLDDYIFNGSDNRFTILHMGGSHIQAGVFTNKTRSNLLRLYPDLISARGMLFPFHIAGTNNPVSYKSSHTGKWTYCKNTQLNAQYGMGILGMCGVPADTNSTASISMRNNDSISFTFSTLYLLGYCDSGWVRPKIIYLDTLTAYGQYDTNISAYCFRLDTNIDAFTVAFESISDTVWENFYLRGFYADHHRGGLSYVDIGVNGASVPSYLRCEYLEKDLRLLKPDLCIFSIGINDASGTDFDTAVFIQNYKQLITRIRSVAPDCQVLFTTNNDSYRKVKRSYINNPNGLLVEYAFRSLAAYYHTGMFDWFAYMGGLKSMAEWEKEGLAKKDKIHFTNAGYIIWGDVLYNVILQEYEKHLTRKAQSDGME